MTKLYQIPRVPLELLENKTIARQSVMLAIRRGDLAPISECHCALCGVEAHFYHHHSYSPADFLNVTPLCGACHKLLHSLGSEQFLNERIGRIEKSQTRAIKQARTSLVDSIDRKVAIRWMVILEQQLSFLRELKERIEAF